MRAILNVSNLTTRLRLGKGILTQQQAAIKKIENPSLTSLEKYEHSLAI